MLDAYIELMGPRVLQNKEYPRIIKNLGMFFTGQSPVMRQSAKQSFSRLSQMAGVMELETALKRVLPAQHFSQIKKLLDKGISEDLNVGGAVPSASNAAAIRASLGSRAASRGGPTPLGRTKSTNPVGGSPGKDGTLQREFTFPMTGSSSGVGGGAGMSRGGTGTAGVDFVESTDLFGNPSPLSGLEGVGVRRVATDPTGTSSLRGSTRAVLERKASSCVFDDVASRRIDAHS